MEIPRAQVEKILKEQTGMRVGADAVEELANYLEEVAMDLGSTAADLAESAKRKTIRDDDLKLAYKRM